MDKPISNPSIDFSRINKILILRLGKIGDIVVTSFVFEVIKKEYPSAEIHLLTYESNRDTLKYNPSIHRIIYAKRNISSYLRMFAVIFKRFDLIMDFNDNPSSTSAFIFRFSSANIKAGYNFKKYEGLINFRITPLPRDSSHIIVRMKNFLEQLGFSAGAEIVKPYFYLGSSENNDVETEFSSVRCNKKLISVNLSSGAEIRYWGLDKWISFLKEVAAKYPDFYFILLSLKKDEKLKNEIEASLGADFCQPVKFSSIQHFAAYIKISDLLISPDTSAVHIASAFGVPTLALYPCPEWNYVSWLPYNVTYRAVKSSSEDINEIPVQEVFIKFESLINEIGLTKC